jgi:hypothetical protein
LSDFGGNCDFGIISQNIAIFGEKSSNTQKFERKGRVFQKFSKSFKNLQNPLKLRFWLKIFKKPKICAEIAISAGIFKNLQKLIFG